jgi:hypothetical protein
MKKMKKVLAMIMVIAIMFGGMVFADPPTTENKSFTLATTVAGVLSTKITEASTSTSAIFQNASDLITKVVTTDGEGLPENTVFYFNIRTNITSPIIVAVKATNFISSTNATSNTSEISYTLSTIATSGDGISDNVTITSSSAPDTFTTFYKYTKPDTGLKIDSRKITASLNTAEFAEANQDSYKATVTFNVYTT